jgi:membrane protease YdiL (CAAX protease family)
MKSAALTATTARGRFDRRSATREIAIFLATTALLTTVSTGVAVAEDVDVRRIEDASTLGQTAMYLQAMFPLVGAVVARIATTGTLRRPDWGFRRPSWRSIAAAWGYGLAIALGGGLLVWATGAGSLDADAFGTDVVLGLTVLVLPYVVLALGEDVGWRGLLVPRLAAFYSPRTVVLLGGLIWSSFHWPLIAMLGGTPEGVSVAYALVMFTVSITALGAVLASMQLRWGIWPGLVAHAVMNATLYHVVEPLTTELDHTSWFATETGLFAAVAGSVGAALWWWRRPLVAGSDGGTRVPGE